MARSTFFSRLALALLALCGFVAPLAPERDVMVQRAGAAPRPLEVEPSADGVWPPATPRSVEVTDAAPHLVHPAATRRYLLHRAWLI